MDEETIPPSDGRTTSSRWFRCVLVKPWEQNMQLAKTPPSFNTAANGLCCCDASRAAVSLGRWSCATDGSLGEAPPSMSPHRFLPCDLSFKLAVLLSFLGPSSGAFEA